MGLFFFLNRKTESLCSLKKLFASLSDDKNVIENARIPLRVWLG